MGREIRRVPPDWVHATRMHQYLGRPMEMVPVPMFDKAYADAVAEWERGRAAWDADEPLPDDWQDPKRRPSQLDTECASWEEWRGGPPDPESYRDRSWTTEEATAYQVYENVTEGTPISPVLLTYDDLIAWLMGNHEHWTAMSRPGAEAFARDAWVPSLVLDGHGIEEGVEWVDRIARESAWDVTDG